MRKKALADFEQAANLEPTNPGVLGTLTSTYVRLQRPQDAERIAKRAVTFNKQDPNAYIAYGQVLASEGKFDQAREQLENAVKLSPKDNAPDPDRGADLSVRKTRSRSPRACTIVRSPSTRPASKRWSVRRASPRPSTTSRTRSRRTSGSIRCRPIRTTRSR